MSYHCNVKVKNRPQVHQHTYMSKKKHAQHGENCHRAEEAFILRRAEI